MGAPRNRSRISGLGLLNDTGVCDRTPVGRADLGSVYDKAPAQRNRAPDVEYVAREEAPPASGGAGTHLAACMNHSNMRTFYIVIVLTQRVEKATRRTVHTPTLPATSGSCVCLLSSVQDR
jgi:hypothetical protein